MAATSSPFQWPSYASAGFGPDTFPYADPLQFLSSTFWALPTASYGRWNGTGVSQGLGYPSGINPGPAGGYGLFGGGGAAAGGAGGAGGGGGYTPPTVQPKAAAGGGAYNPASDPGFGAAPSSAAFPNLSDQDKAYLYRMQQQYRQDLRGVPGSHQLFFDLFGGQQSPEQINALINDIGLNSSILPSFNPQAYSGPMAALYQQAVQQRGGNVNPYGTWTGRDAAIADAKRRFSGARPLFLGG